MASIESGAVRDLYLGWTAARIKGEQQDKERWGDLTAEPRAVDYIERDDGPGGDSALSPRTIEQLRDHALKPMTRVRYTRAHGTAH